jgi:hypothetical protein
VPPAQHRSVRVAGLGAVGPIPRSVYSRRDDGDVRVPLGELVGQEAVAAHHEIAGLGQIPGAVAAGIEPHCVIDVQDHRSLGQGMEGREGGEKLTGDPGHISFPGAGECGRAGHRRCRHPHRAQATLPRQYVAPGQRILPHRDAESAERVDVLAHARSGAWHHLAAGVRCYSHGSRSGSRATAQRGVARRLIAGAK